MGFEYGTTDGKAIERIACEPPPPPSDGDDISMNKFYVFKKSDDGVLCLVKLSPDILMQIIGNR